MLYSASDGRTVLLVRCVGVVGRSATSGVSGCVHARGGQFVVGQVAFSVLVVVLFNILAPTDWQIGLVRVEDAALGVGISAVVGLRDFAQRPPPAGGRSI